MLRRQCDEWQGDVLRVGDCVVIAGGRFNGKTTLARRLALRTASRIENYWRSASLMECASARIPLVLEHSNEHRDSPFATNDVASFAASVARLHAMPASLAGVRQRPHSVVLWDDARLPPHTRRDGGPPPALDAPSAEAAQRALELLSPLLSSREAREAARCTVIVVLQELLLADAAALALVVRGADVLCVAHGTPPEEVTALRAADATREVRLLPSSSDALAPLTLHELLVADGRDGMPVRLARTGARVPLVPMAVAVQRRRDDVTAMHAAERRGVPWVGRLPSYHEDDEDAWPQWRTRSRNGDDALLSMLGLKDDDDAQAASSAVAP